MNERLEGIERRLKRMVPKQSGDYATWDVNGLIDDTRYLLDEIERLKQRFFTVRPMDQAPKDGHWIIGIIGHEGQAEFMRWDREKQYWTTSAVGGYEPLGWMESPTPASIT